MAERDYTQEAKELLALQVQVYKIIHSIVAQKIKNRPVRLSKAQSTKLREGVRKLLVSDLNSYLKYILSIPFSESMAVLSVPKKYQHKVEGYLKKAREQSQLILVREALRNGWLKPLPR